MQNDELLAAHTLEETKNDKKIDLMDNFLNFKLNLFAGFLCVCLLCLLFKVLIVCCKRGIKLCQKNFRARRTSPGQLSRKFLAIAFSNKRRIAALSLFLLFYDQFLWFSGNLVTSSIKTDKVIVDTRLAGRFWGLKKKNPNLFGYFNSMIIENLDDAFSTKRTLCLYKNDIEHKISLLSSKNNVIRRLFEKKGRVREPISGITGEFCLVEAVPEVVNIDFSKVFTISKYSHTLLMAIFLRDLKSGFVGFMSKPIYSMNLHLYHVFEKEEEQFIQTL